MNGFLRRLRGVICTGLTWAVGWAGVYAGLLALAGLDPLNPTFILRAALNNGIAGFVAGGSFAVILSVAERRHQLEDLSLKRVGVWGALGGLVVVGLLGVLSGAFFWEEALFGAFFGAASASGSVALAKRAGGAKQLEGSDEDPGLLEGD